MIILTRKNKIDYKKKGQISIEAMISFGILFMIFIASFWIYQNKYADLNESEIIIQESGECLKLANNLANIFTSGEGSQITVNLEKSMTVNPAEKRITTEHTLCLIHFSEIEYLGSRANFDLMIGEYQIINRGDYVEII